MTSDPWLRRIFVNRNVLCSDGPVVAHDRIIEEGSAGLTEINDSEAHVQSWQEQ